MPTVESSNHLSAVVLLGKGLAPGKLRSLQRVCNPNSSMPWRGLLRGHPGS